MRHLRDIAAVNVGASLEYVAVAVGRAPKASGAAADRSGKLPVVALAPHAGAEVAG